MIEEVIGALSGWVRGITEVIAKENALIWRIASKTMDHHYREIVFPEFTWQYWVISV
jgi:hypothetical protein